MFKDIKAAIFDMDGTIVDSMWVWESIDINYLNTNNLHLPPTLKTDIAHLSYNEVAVYFKNAFNLPYTIDEIKEHWNELAYKEYCTNVKLKPGVKKFMDLLKSMGIKIALATSNNRLLLEACLKSNGIYDYFDVITTTDEVANGKDCPDVYLLTAERLGIAPENCIVFEDILAAVKGAKLANMKVIGVYDDHAACQHDEMIKIADKFIKEYDELLKEIQ